MKRIIAIVIVIFLFVLPINAEKINNDVFSQIQDELNIFKESVPQEIMDLFPNEIWNGDFSGLIESNLNETSIIDKVLDYFFIGINEAFKNFAVILILIIVASVFNSLGQTFSSNLITTTFSFASTLCISISVFSLCHNIISMVSSYIKALCIVMESIAPLMSTLYIMTGNITSAGFANASLILFISFIEQFLIIFMLPIVNICLSFSIMKAINSNLDFSGITKILKNTFVSVTVFVMSILMFVFSSKNILAQASDTLSIKTAKFAISSFIPIVGSTVNEALKTVVASLSSIKSSCGIIVIIVIALLMLPIIISLLVNRLFFNISASLARTLNCSSESSIFEEAGSICGFLLALILCTCILFIFTISILIKTTVIA